MILKYFSLEKSYKDIINNYIIPLKNHFLTNTYLLCGTFVFSINEPEKFTYSYAHKCFIVVSVSTLVAYYIIAGGYSIYLSYNQPEPPFYIMCWRGISKPPSKKTGEIPRERLPKACREWREEQLKAEQDRNSSSSETVVENAPELNPQTIPQLSEFPIISGTLQNSKFNTPRNPLSKTSSSSSSSFSIYETFSEKIENLTAINDVLVFFSLTSRFVILIFMWYLWKWCIYKI